MIIRIADDVEAPIEIPPQQPIGVFV